MQDLETPKSSTIRKITYDGHNLYIEFKPNGKYEYIGVSPELFEEARYVSSHGGSIGRWFLVKIKRNYPSRKIG